MTISEMVTYFDTLQDKASSAYFSDAEKELFLNRAQIIFIEEMVNSDIDGKLNFYERGNVETRSIENTLGSTDALAPLIVTDMENIDGSNTRLATSSSGNLTKDDIDAAITQSSSKSTGLMKVLAFAVDDGDTYFKPTKYVRQNDLYKFLQNDFLIPTSSSPIWTNHRENFKFYPKEVMNIVASAIRYPEPMVVGTTGCELPDFTHDKIVSIALNEAGLGSRDDMLMKLNGSRNL